MTGIFLFHLTFQCIAIRRIDQRRRSIVMLTEGKELKGKKRFLLFLLQRLLEFQVKERKTIITTSLFSLLIVKFTCSLSLSLPVTFEKNSSQRKNRTILMDDKMSAVQPTFLFDDRKRFDAQCEHDRVRSSLLSEIEPVTTADPWKQRPIDFSMKNFHPNRKKNSKNIFNRSVGTRETVTGDVSRSLDPTVMEPFVTSYQDLTNRSDESEEFHLDTRIKYNRIKRMLNTEQYRNPQPHDYRQVTNEHCLSMLIFAY